MENHNPVIGSKPQVAFDPCARFERGRKREEAVFREAGAVVKAPVRETFRSGV
jgi:hypothetical protein